MDLDWDFRLSLINDILKENIHQEHLIADIVYSLNIVTLPHQKYS